MTCCTTDPESCHSILIRAGDKLTSHKPKGVTFVLHDRPSCHSPLRTGRALDRAVNHRFQSRDACLSVSCGAPTFLGYALSQIWTNRHQFCRARGRFQSSTEQTARHNRQLVTSSRELPPHNTSIVRELCPFAGVAALKPIYRLCRLGRTPVVLLGERSAHRAADVEALSRDGGWTMGSARAHPPFPGRCVSCSPHAQCLPDLFLSQHSRIRLFAQSRASLCVDALDAKLYSP